ncbi:MAG TPA: VWA domain-containing protein [Terriglobales bacterium]|nr:VWA domain-containing protein [Terriglobales bacterium]
MIAPIPRLRLSAALLVLSAVASPAADPSSSARTAPVLSVLTIRKRVEEVQVVFTVQDGNKLVTDVTGDQLTLLEDGQRVLGLTTFRQQFDLPLRVALLVDCSDSMQKGFAAEQQAARRFLERLLRPNIDSVLLAEFSTHVSISQQPPGSAQLISTELQSMHVSGLTALYDALFETSQHSMMNGRELQPSRRVAFLLSDGDDNYSRYSLEDAIAAAQQSEIVIYAITAHNDSRRHPGDAVLQRLAKATGGRAFVLKSFNRVDQVFAQIGDELRTQYSVTFHPLSADRCGYHAIELRHRNPRLRIRARDGYYGCRP